MEKTITVSELLENLQQDGWERRKTPNYYLGIPYINQDGNLEDLYEIWGLDPWKNDYTKELKEDLEFHQKYNLVRSDFFHYKDGILIWFIVNNDFEKIPPFIHTNQISKYGCETTISDFTTYDQFLEKLEQCVIQNKIFHLQKQLS